MGPHAFFMRWKGKCISSCDMKTHWLVEMAKWVDGSKIPIGDFHVHFPIT
jgi:hypothetical protein